MKKSIALISVFAVLMIAFSGCVDNNTPAANGTDSNNPETNAISDDDAAGISTLETLPTGFEYVGTLPLSTDDIKSDYKAENASGILGGSEGLYKYSSANVTDFYIDVIEFENAEDASGFISIYQSSFMPLQSGSRFVEEFFNGHSAVKITEYVRSGGADVPRYSYIWSNENYVLVVSGSTTDNTLVKQLAEATGY
ncbi:MULTISPECIES: hypothetical protein [unclassified Methanosarcina]|uniref:hypothetical protein n=1 Tax=unclassified Methanosarcina TaxID=2644672 RepID=UPI0006160865|nr:MULTISPECIES: hypothetical protein [unclassified Methanosarcina]AKB19325.1 hypothetical protein MSWHS_2462 [Methanosarcina sp. WWM596]AKB22847.1 hypothetical protein MSWH1_2576 [Methanosarcina sp. WH1]